MSINNVSDKFYFSSVSTYSITATKEWLASCIIKKDYQAVFISKDGSEVNREDCNLSTVKKCLKFSIRFFLYIITFNRFHAWASNIFTNNKSKFKLFQENNQQKGSLSINTFKPKKENKTNNNPVRLPEKSKRLKNKNTEQSRAVSSKDVGQKEDLVVSSSDQHEPNAGRYKSGGLGYDKNMKQFGVRNWIINQAQAANMENGFQGGIEFCNDKLQEMEVSLTTLEETWTKASNNQTLTKEHSEYINLGKKKLHQAKEYLKDLQKSKNCKQLFEFLANIKEDTTSIKMKAQLELLDVGDKINCEELFNSYIEMINQEWENLFDFIMEEIEELGESKIDYENDITDEMVMATIIKSFIGNSIQKCYDAIEKCLEDKQKKYFGSDYMQKNYLQINQYRDLLWNNFIEFDKKGNPKVKEDAENVQSQIVNSNIDVLEKDEDEKSFTAFKKTIQEELDKQLKDDPFFTIIKTCKSLKNRWNLCVSKAINSLIMTALTRKTESGYFNFRSFEKETSVSSLKIDLASSNCLAKNIYEGFNHFSEHPFISNEKDQEKIIVLATTVPRFERYDKISTKQKSNYHEEKTENEGKITAIVQPRIIFCSKAQLKTVKRHIDARLKEITAQIGLKPKLT